MLLLNGQMSFSNQQHLVGRWSDFLSKIEQKFRESLQLGKQAVLDSLEENDYDYYASERTLYAIKSQISATLVNKIDEVSADQVLPAMRADGDYWVDEIARGHHLREDLYRQLTLWEIDLEGTLSQKYYDHAIVLINKNFYCTQCKSPLAIRRQFFQSQYVTCLYCNTVNTFEPETKYVQIGWNVVDNIARQNAMEEYRIMQEAGDLKREVDPRNSTNSTTHNESYRDACKKYVERFFTERIKLLPDTAAGFTADVARELKQKFNY
jgi:RNase P subunit RPR2